MNYTCGQWKNNKNKKKYPHQRHVWDSIES